MDITSATAMILIVTFSYVLIPVALIILVIWHIRKLNRIELALQEVQEKLENM